MAGRACADKPRSARPWSIRPRPGPRIWSTGSSRSPRPTAYWWPTSPTSGSRAGCSSTSRSSSMPTPARSSAGRSRDRSRLDSWSPRSARPSRCDPGRGTPLRAQSTTPTPAPRAVHLGPLRRDAVVVRAAALGRLGRRRLRQCPGRDHHRAVQERVRPLRLPIPARTAAGLDRRRVNHRRLG